MIVSFNSIVDCSHKPSLFPFLTQTPGKTVEFNTQSNHNIVGCDFAGIVEEIGSEVPEGVRKIGERVAGFVHGSELCFQHTTITSPSPLFRRTETDICQGIHKDRGSYAEYLVADARLVISLPENLSFENAAGLGVTGFTACQMLYQVQHLATPYSPTTTREPVLVWSGASAVGQYVIQIAKLSGYTVITTASEKNHAYLKSIGADAVFDYKDPEVAQKIRAYTEGKLKIALDCISEKDTPQKISDSLSPEGGKVSAILPYETVRPEVEIEISIAYSLLGKVCSSSLF
jgi:NADPH:quinone reductase-like Zn-dependent oxidoreductase